MIGRKELSILSILLSFILIYMLCVINNEEVTITTLETTTQSTETSQVTTSNYDVENHLKNLTYDKDVVISNFILFNHKYYAIGNENNVPYMQEIDLNNEEYIMNNPYLYNNHVGTVENLIDNGYYLQAVIENSDGTYTQNFIETNGTFIPFFKEQLQFNYYQGMTITPKYLVIHETANTDIGANAEAHYNYWNTIPTALASTHFVVDNTQIYQLLQLNQAGWHVGDNHGYSDITNYNSIGIEICVNADGNYTIARQNAIDLTIQIMNALHMNISQLKRHHDASGKNCPSTMILNPELWTDFINQVQKGLLY